MSLNDALLAAFVAGIAFDSLTTAKRWWWLVWAAAFVVYITVVYGYAHDHTCLSTLP